MHENRIGVFSGKVTPILRSARLENHRLALARTRDVQRAFDREELALVVKRMQLAWGEEFAAVFVIGKGIVLPGIP